MTRVRDRQEGEKSMSGDHQGHGEALSVGEPPDGPQPSSNVRREIEVILARQLAGYLTIPIVIVDPTHLVLYYNEPAEHMLGRRFDDGGPIPWKEWSRTFAITDDAGDPIPSTDLPLASALQARRAAHRTVWLQSLQGARRRYDETAIPIIGTAGRFLGAIAFFEETAP